MPLDPKIVALVIAPIVGSFLGVLALRLPVGHDIAFSRSACRHCGRVLGIADLVPLISWLLLRGRCRCCARPLGRFYPTIECAALAVALWAAALLDDWLLLASCGLGWALLVLAVIDWRHLLLPDGLTLPLIPAGLAVAVAIDPAFLMPHLVGAAGGYGLFAATAWLYRRLRGRDGLGLGDAKLLAAAGAWLSWQGLPSVVLIAALLGLAAAAVVRTLGHPITLHHRVPFGPCICLAIWTVWLYGPLRLVEC